MHDEARPSAPSPTSHRGLGLVDFTLLVVGAVIGADVYIVVGLGASLLGPAQLVAWLVAGALAAFIALAFVQCAAICPGAGGSYAYARTAFGPLAGFLTGFALYVGEWVALPVFPLVFVTYLAYFIPNLSTTLSVLIKVLLIALVTLTNLFGVRAGSRVNDVLTTAKLVPLAVLIVAGLALAGVHPSVAAQHLRPFAPLGWSGFGAAVQLIFWAYAGFEVAVLPAAAVRDPRRTLPRGLIIGMGVVTLFYTLTSFAVTAALPWQASAASARPLADALGSINSRFGVPVGWGRTLMSLGAVVSIAGVYQVFTLTLARLSYAMAADGLFPSIFARLHPRFGTPLGGLAVQAAWALVAALLFHVQNLIAISMFFLGLCYLATALAALRLLRRSPEHILHVPGLRPALVLGGVGAIVLSISTPPRLILIGTGIMIVGLAAFVIRRDAWRLAAKGETESERAAGRIEGWARSHEAWLWQTARRLIHSRGEGERRR